MSHSTDTTASGPRQTFTPEIGGEVTAAAADWGPWLVWLDVTDYASGARSSVAMDPAEALAVATALANAADHVAAQPPLTRAPLDRPDTKEGGDPR